MAIQEMRLCRIAGSKENIHSILLTAFHSTVFHPELATHVISSAKDGYLLPDDNKYNDYVGRIESISKALQCELHTDASYSEPYTDTEIEAYIASIEERYEKLNEEMLSHSNLTDEDRQALDQLKEYDFDSLNSARYVRSKFGRFPNSSIAKLALHNNDRFIYTVLHKNNHYQWIFYISLESDQAEIDEMFDSLYFEPISIPKIDESEIVHACEIDMLRIYGYIKEQAEIRKLYKYIVLFDETLVLTGFVPKSEMKTFKEQFNEHEDVIIQDFDAKLEEGIKAPTVLINSRFSKPFEMFVEMYSLPKYGTFDPTPYVSITYCLLFGMMFGDFGQGLCISLIGIFMDKKLHMKLGKILERIGIFSAFFGLVYGSLFGNEELLGELYQKVGITFLPISVMHVEIMNLLGAALAVGVCLIIISMIYNIIERFKRHDFGEALFSQNGVAGLTFYVSLIAGVLIEMFLKVKVMNKLYIACLIVLPLLVILFKEPFIHLLQKKTVKPHEGWGGYILQSFFEVFEVLLSFLSNTMSFLRVGGFILSHAGMMLVVMTLNEMVGNMGFLVLVFGNIFVMALEGLIVGIQTLRLEYYEMFSRYYDGGGKKFTPISLSELN